ncbi:MAG: ABC transporter ATP-binding protein, partial [Burkholderiaceae bacterium]|nr:ABC transporter ATP-binding protein [Burkholderiaceae bacterium]
KLRTSARDELQQFQRRLGTTTVYVTHDQIEAMGLGDRIAVLDHGRVRQLGTPLEVYHEPADTFVAAFLGSPPMNLMEDGPSLCGFRPEHLLPRASFPPADAVVEFPLTVTRIEHLGADRLVYATLQPPHPRTRVVCRLPSNVAVPLETGVRYAFALRHDDLRYFDRATGLKRPAVTT